MTHAHLLRNGQFTEFIAAARSPKDNDPIHVTKQTITLIEPLTQTRPWAYLTNSFNIISQFQFTLDAFEISDVQLIGMDTWMSRNLISSLNMKDNNPECHRNN